MKKIIIIGSTGSIGRNAIKVLSNKTLAGRFKVVGLSANSNLKLLEKQILSLKPEAVCSGTESDAEYFKNKFPGLMVYWGNQGLKSLAASSADLVLIAVVGAVGMYPLVSALEAGKTVALANKESLVIAGGLISNIVNKGKGKIIPVDSEHSAVFQCLLGEDRQNIKRLILTGSGGPFYNKKINFSKITVQEALRHPNWKMGKKITIDSATLMNKGLEVIEASHLFNIPINRIKILIHPQSIIHSMVEFIDNSIKALLSVPDMRLAIQYALTYPQRFVTKVKTLNVAGVKNFSFYEPDFKRFPCLGLALKAGKAGGTLPAVLNASNEVAVNAFLKGRIKFSDIDDVISKVMSKHRNIISPDLDDIIEVDRWARAEAQLLC